MWGIKLPFGPKEPQVGVKYKFRQTKDGEKYIDADIEISRRDFNRVGARLENQLVKLQEIEKAWKEGRIA